MVAGIIYNSLILNSKISFLFLLKYEEEDQHDQYKEPKGEIRI